MIHRQVKLFRIPNASALNQQTNTTWKKIKIKKGQTCVRIQIEQFGTTMWN